MYRLVCKQKFDSRKLPLAWNEKNSRGKVNSQLDSYGELINLPTVAWC